MGQLYLDAPVKKLPHNYFPAPEKPFVLNLASGNGEIRKRSVDHCIKGLQLAAASGAPFFSAHAGFCGDPDPSELGKELKKAASVDRKHNWRLFIESLRTILREAEKNKTGFLIENNVIASMNLYPDGTNPLFCSDAAEMLAMIAEVNHPRLGILLDTGHLKVSSGTLKFNLAEDLKAVKPYIRCIHHSDNDGIFDTNEPLTDGYWFWKHIRDFAGVYHVLEVKKQTIREVNTQISLIRSHIS